MENTEQVLQKIYELAIAYGLKLIGAIIVLIVGFWIIRIIIKSVVKMMEKREVDSTLRSFLKALLSATLKILLIISIMSMVGIEMTSFVAILAMAGLAVGMALSGTLQNFAGGVMLILFKPFKVGDYIDALGYSGTVSEVQIFITVLKTPDNKTIVIPNGPLSTNALTNFSTEENRRVDFTFGISYNDDIDKSRQVIEGLIKADERIFSDPSPFVQVGELADSSVNFTVRVWAKASDYWGIYFDLTEKVKKSFDKEGISIPYPQTDIHLYQEKK